MAPTPSLGACSTPPVTKRTSAPVPSAAPTRTSSTTADQGRSTPRSRSSFACDAGVGEPRRGRGEVGGPGPEEQLAVPGACVGEDERVDLPHPQCRDGGGQT